MPTMKMIRRRLLSVSNTKKIMKAMNMVASSKLQKDKVRLEDSRPFFDEINALIDRLKGCGNVDNSSFLVPRQVKNAVYVVITGDRGLCGSFNTNAAEKARSHMAAAAAENNTVIAVGLKGLEYFKRRGIPVMQKYEGILETAFYEDAASITRFLMELYMSGDADEIYITYTKFASVLNHVPAVVRLLPLTQDAKVQENPAEMNYEPDSTAFFDHMIPMYITAVVYTALLESSACEQAARMTSMDAAEKNAADIISKLTRIYNRRRQTAITQEISEIVSGTNVTNPFEKVRESEEVNLFEHAE